MPSIYQITYSNGKIYIGSDITDSINYFGSVSAKALYHDYNYLDEISFSKKIIYYNKNITRKKLLKLEMEIIKLLESNNPEKGYNLNPKFKNIT